MKGEAKTSEEKSFFFFIVFNLSMAKNLCFRAQKEANNVLLTQTKLAMGLAKSFGQGYAILA